MISRFYIILVCLVVSGRCSVFDEELYQQVLDPVLCNEQLALLSDDDGFGLSLFLDASGKLPTGILRGNVDDLGDYDYCLSIDKQIRDQRIQGKYCSIHIPLLSSIRKGILGLVPPENLDTRTWNTTRSEFVEFIKTTHTVGVAQRRVDPTSPPFTVSDLSLGVCVPRSCTPTQAIHFLLERLPLPISTDDQIVENFCRLPGDKPFTAGDYIAIAIFSAIGLLTLMSTSYDLYYTFVLKVEPRRVSRQWSVFSVYTNTRRFMTVTSVPGALHCLDGVRAISMLWILFGHTFLLTTTISVSNMSYILEALLRYNSVLVTAGTFAVDSFLLISGTLCVYSTIGKYDKTRFIKSIPVFYLHRLLRLFPLLATVVLLQSTLVNHLSDGPQWTVMAKAIQACRDNWWLTLLYLQNYAATEVCIRQSWYLSVDMQLYIACPLVLVFLFGRSLQARIALAVALVLTLSSVTFISFYYNFSGALFRIRRLNEEADYTRYYFRNTFARASPFAIGMIYGYLLHVYREKRIKIRMHHNILLWLASLIVMGLAVFQVPILMQPEFDSQLVDSFVNAFTRPLWAAALGFIIFACTQGYGGPVNWFLSHRMWKLPARLSYAMYLTHIAVMYVTTSSATQTHRFGTGETLFRFSANLVWIIIASLVLTILIDSPCSTLQKMLFERASKPTKDESLGSVTA